MSKRDGCKDSRCRRLRSEEKRKIEKLERAMSEVEKENGSLREERDTLGEENGSLREEKGKVEEKLTVALKENEKLSRQLNYYDNANTPPSHKTLTQEKQKKQQRDSDASVTTVKPAKRGAPYGHRGVTNKPKPTEYKEHIAINCSKCGSTNLQKSEIVEIRNITEIPPPPGSITTQHIICRSNCNDCGKENIVADSVKELPKSGNYGKNVILHAVRQFENRLPFRRISDDLKSYNVSISPTTVYKIVRDTGIKMHKKAMDIRREIISGEILHIDETSTSLNGKKAWIWTFHDPFIKKTQYIIRESRGGDVIKDVLPPKWKGVIVCDGWGPYKKYERQRCWAHIVNEPKNLATKYGTPETLDALRKIQEIYIMALGTYEWDDARTPKQMQKRIEFKSYLHSRVGDVVFEYKDNRILKTFMTKLDNANPNLFQFVLNPNIPSTNNAAERALRELIVHRKIRGALRALETLTWLGDMHTCFVTWKDNKMDISKKLRNLI